MKTFLFVVALVWLGIPTFFMAVGFFQWLVQCGWL